MSREYRSFRPIRTLATALVLFLTAVLPRTASAANDGTLQGLIGAAAFDADSLTFPVPSADAVDEEDLSSMPYVGLFGQYFLSGESTRVGVEGGALFGWRSRESSVLLGNTQAVVKIDSSFWMLDLSAGVCLSQRLGRRWRLYLGAGPAMVFAEYEADGEIEEGNASDPETAAAASGDSLSEFGIGAYGRAGLEYEYSPTAFVGVSVRGLATDLEFGQTTGSSEVNGVQGFVTFTRHFRVY